MKKLSILTLALFFTLPLYSQKAIEYILVSWNENTEADLAGYKVYIGKASRVYTDSVDVGLQDEKLFKGSFYPNIKYYVAVAAYDTSGNLSGYSDEATFYKRVIIDSLPPLPPGKPSIKELIERFRGD